MNRRFNVHVCVYLSTFGSHYYRDKAGKLYKAGSCMRVNHDRSKATYHVAKSYEYGFGS